MIHVHVEAVRNIRSVAVNKQAKAERVLLFM